MNVLILNSVDGNWEGLFVNGKLEYECHSFDSIVLLKKSEELGFKSSDIKFEEVTKEDNEYLKGCGSFPNKLEELKGNYN